MADPGQHAQRPNRRDWPMALAVIAAVLGLALVMWIFVEVISGA